MLISGNNLFLGGGFGIFIPDHFAYAAVFDKAVLPGVQTDTNSLRSSDVFFARFDI